MFIIASCHLAHSFDSMLLKVYFFLSVITSTKLNSMEPSSHRRTVSNTISICTCSNGDDEVFVKVTGYNKGVY